MIEPNLPPDREAELEAAAEREKGAAKAAPKPRFTENYEVGYARPPKAKRWRKGQSGNPVGRPRKQPNFGEALKEVLAETFVITIESEKRTVTMQEALLLKLKAEVSSGDRRCIKLMRQILDAAPAPTPDPDEHDIDRLVMQLKFAENPVLQGMKAELANRGSDD